MKRTVLVVLSVLSMLLLALAPPASTQEQSVERLVFIVPPGFEENSIIVVEGILPMNVTIDSNGNGVRDEGELTIEVPGVGLGRLVLSPSGAGLVSIIVSGGPASGLLVYKDLALGMAAASGSLSQGSTLYLPPVPGAVAIGNPTDGVVEVEAPQGNLTLEPGEVLVACSWGGVVRANSSIVGLYFYRDLATGRAALSAIATESDLVVSLGFSKLQLPRTMPGVEVYAGVVYENGSSKLLRVDRAPLDVPLGGRAAVYYVLVSQDQLAVSMARPYGSLPYQEGGVLVVRGEGFVLPSATIVLSSRYAGYAVLADIDGDGSYEVPLFDFGTFKVWVEDPLGGAVVYVRGAPPMVLEHSPGMAALYYYAAPNPGNITDLTLRDILDNEYVEAQIVPGDGSVYVDLVIVPRPGKGGVTNAVSAAFTMGLEPIKATAVAPLSNGTALRAMVPIPPEAFNRGSLALTLLAYQGGVSVVAIPAVNATHAVVEASGDPVNPWCPPLDYPYFLGPVGEASLESLSIYQPNPLGKLDLVGLAELIRDAVPEQPTSTPTQTTTQPPPSPPPPPQEPPSILPRLVSAAAALAAIVIVILLLRRMRNP